MKPVARSAAVVLVLAACGFVGCGESSNGGTPIADAGPDVVGNSALCPASLPVAGTACPVALGSTCKYTCASGDAGNAVCNSGLWVIGRTDVVCPPKDAGPPGPFACGSVTCLGTELCVQPCCGGTAPPCLAKGDGGTCPVGTHEIPNCAFGTAPGPGNYCKGDPCVPPAAYCSPTAPVGCTPDAPGSRKLRCVCA